MPGVQKRRVDLPDLGDGALLLVGANGRNNCLA
jgi:hypothetical protein